MKRWLWIFLMAFAATGLVGCGEEVEEELDEGDGVEIEGEGEIGD